jgi:hypothetical protein
MTLDRWIAVIGLAFGLVSIGLAVYFYRRTVKMRTPTFVVNPSRSTLVAPDIENFGKFSAFHDGHPLSFNGVTLLQVYFWNSGSLEIMSSEVLKPYSISISDGSILSWSVIKTNRDVIHAQLIRPNEASNSLELSFAVLEPNDGAVFQIAYDGPRNARVEFDGTCVGSPRPTVLPSAPLYFSTRAEQLLEVYMPFIAPLVLGAIGYPLFWGIRLVISHFFGERAFGTLVISFVVCLVALAAISAFWGQYRRATAKYVPHDIRLP